MADAAGQNKKVPDTVHIGPSQLVKKDAPSVANPPCHQQNQPRRGKGRRQSPRLENHRPPHGYIASQGELFKPPQADGIEGDANNRRRPDSPE